MPNSLHHSRVSLWVPCLFVAFTLAFLYTALRPFQLTFPHRVNQGVERVGTGIRFALPGVAKITNMRQWLPEVISSRTMVMDLRVRSTSVDQFGPARIVSISLNTWRRNLTIGQHGRSLIIRLRTPDTTLNAMPEHEVPEVFADASWQDIQLRVAENELTVTVNGVAALSEQLPNEPLQSWSPEHWVLLGNELSLDRPWLGEISAATISADSTQVDLLDQKFCQIPEWWWPPHKFKFFAWRPDMMLHRRLITDMVLNFLIFVPICYLLAAILPPDGAVLRAILVCAAVSLFVEAAQLLINDRYPAASDLVLNIAGAIVGGLLARWYPRGKAAQ